MKSVVEYFQEMYGFTIQYTHLPCLQVGNQKKANYLPMEVENHLSIFLFDSGVNLHVNGLITLFFRRVKLLRANAIQNG